MTSVRPEGRGRAARATRRWPTPVGALLVALAAACSTSSGTLTNDAATRQQDAGRDAEAGTTDGGATAVDAGKPAPFDGTCSGIECPDSGIDTPGCCTAEGTGVPGHVLENTGRAPQLCGTDVGDVFPALAGICVQMHQPGRIDRECPAQEQLGGGIVMPGCCTDEGYCGSLERVVGFGCFYATGRKGRPCTVDPDADAGS